jgi:hypothetical protein
MKINIINFIILFSFLSIHLTIIIDYFTRNNFHFRDDIPISTGIILIVFSSIFIISYLSTCFII